MLTRQECFEILGVASDASPNEIRRAYLRLVLLYHPDKSSARYTDRYLRVVEAYKRLMSSTDCGRDRDRDSDDTPFRRIVLSRNLQACLYWCLATMSYCMQQQQQQQPQQQHNDIHVSIDVTLEELHAGKLKRIQICVMRRRRPFDTGRYPTSQVLLLRLHVPEPYNVPPPWSFTFTNAGDDPPSWSDGGRSDVVVRVTVRPHAAFDVDTVVKTIDVHAVINVSPFDYYYGRDIEIPYLDGTDIITRYCGTAENVTHFEKGRGLPNVEGERGDLYVFFKLQMPTIPQSVLDLPHINDAFRLLFIQPAA